jgi:hypothetical protein
MAYRLTVDQALAIRSVAGPLSIVALVGLEMGIRYMRWGKRAFGGGDKHPLANTAPTS